MILCLFWELYKQLKAERKNINGMVVDAGYKMPAIVKQILEDGKTPILPYKRPMTKEGFFKKYEYVYDEFYDCYICPNNQVLNYSTTNREGYKEYKSDKSKCKVARYRNQCTKAKTMSKWYTRHVWEEYMEKVEDIRHTIGVKQIYSFEVRQLNVYLLMQKKNMG